MTLVKCILVVHLSCFCQAFQAPSTQTAPNDIQLQEVEDSEPFIHTPTARCSFTLRMAANSSRAAVALTADSIHGLAEEICQDLKCGSIYSVNETSSPPNATCFHQCLYRDGHLQNCSQTQGRKCKVIAAADCGHKAVRLTGGSDRCAGRVELWRDGRWGTVCDDQWDLRDAEVVCAQLGCGYALSVTGQGGPFPPGGGPVHLDELNCSGKEEKLWDCPAAQDEPDCGHKEDAGVVCSEMRAIRLTGGLDRCSGRVEVHRNGSWGTVCDNCWNKNMAAMVCSMLQCGAVPKNFSQFFPPLMHNDGTLWFYQCDPNMQSLWQCKEIINKLHLCKDSKASGVICNGSLGFPKASAATTAHTPVITSGTTEVATSFVVPEGLTSPSKELLSSIALLLLLLVFLITNTVLCCHYRRKHAMLLRQTRASQRPLAERHRSGYPDAVDVVKVTTYPQTDDFNPYKPVVNPLMKPSSLCEEGTEARSKEIGAFRGSDGPADTRDARVSNISVNSFDASSTSSGACYQNTNGYVVVTPDPGPRQSSVYTADPLRAHSRDQHSSGDEDEGPIYSPVCPDEDTSSEDDYEGIGS